MAGDSAHEKRITAELIARGPTDTQRLAVVLALGMGRARTSGALSVPYACLVSSAPR
jgi:hypothetical protein